MRVRGGKIGKFRSELCSNGKDFFGNFLALRKGPFMSGMESDFRGPRNEI